MSAYIPLILFTVITNFVSQILLKQGMTVIDEFEISFSGVMSAASDILFNWYVILGLFVMVVSMASHLVVLALPILF